MRSRSREGYGSKATLWDHLRQPQKSSAQKILNNPNRGAKTQGDACHQNANEQHARSEGRLVDFDDRDAEFLRM